jgi:hypothetical protein
VTDDHSVQQHSANSECTKRFAMLLQHLLVLQLGAGSCPKCGRWCRKCTPASQLVSIVGFFTFQSVNLKSQEAACNMLRFEKMRSASRLPTLLEPSAKTETCICTCGINGDRQRSGPNEKGTGKVTHVIAWPANHQSSPQAQNFQSVSPAPDSTAALFWSGSERPGSIHSFADVDRHIPNSRLTWMVFVCFNTSGKEHII